MSSRSIIWFGALVGSTFGGFIPMLWGGDYFSFSSVVWGTIGGVAGIWAGYKLTR